MSRRHAPLGVALIEALVALALLAGVGGTLFVWMHQSLFQAAELESRNEATRRRLMLLEWGQASTLSERSYGSERLAGDLTVRWQTKTIEKPAMAQFPHGGALALHTLQRRLVEVELIDATGHRIERVAWIDLAVQRLPTEEEVR